MEKIKLIVIAVLLTVTNHISAQEAKCCFSYSDFVNNVWTPIGKIYIEENTKAYKSWCGGNDYSFTTLNPAMDKKLKKDVFMLIYQDSLYVNCCNLRLGKRSLGKGYARAYRFRDNEIVFVTSRVGKMSNQNATLASVAAQMAVGIAGAVLVANSLYNDKDAVCYLVTDDAETSKKGKIAIHMMDTHTMEYMLIGSDHYDEYYVEEEKMERESAEYTMNFIKRIGWLKE